MQIRRTREVIERVEVEHEAEGGEPPVITTAEQRVFNATEMERGKPVSGCHISRNYIPSQDADDSAVADSAAACRLVRAWKTLPS